MNPLQKIVPSHSLNGDENQIVPEVGLYYPHTRNKVVRQLISPRFDQVWEQAGNRESGEWACYSVVCEAREQICSEKFYLVRIKNASDALTSRAHDVDL